MVLRQNTAWNATAYLRFLAEQALATQASEAKRFAGSFAPA